jgi:threonine dehydrogenase-like Zn-dependent dehydrogenase
VVEAPAGSGFSEGDLVVGIVRRPDPEPCGACAREEWDMCRNGRYRERGIKELDGYASERWTVPTGFAVGLDPSLGLRGVLMEPTSIVAKAWEQVYRIGERSWFEPRRVLVTGAGPIGLLAALLGQQRDLEVHVLDRDTQGPKPDLVARLGATYHHDDVDKVMRAVRPDIVVEATGAASVVFAALAGTAPYGVVCLTGVSPVGRRIGVDAGGLNRELVLENDAVVGSVNANRRHYGQAAEALARADGDWLRRLITRVVPLHRHEEALERRDGDIKVVLALTEEVRDW